MVRYAQIDKDGRVVSDSQLSGEVNAPHMIRISEDFDLAGKRYVNGKWVKDELKEEATEESSEE